MKIAYIHGAKSSRRSFNWLKDHLPEHDAVFVEYSDSRPLENNIDEIGHRLSIVLPDVIIGHSLGGVIAAMVKAQLPETKIVTLAAPFGGSFAANLMRFHGQMYSDVASWNPLFSHLKLQAFDHSFLALVATGMESERVPNDGVVTVASQESLTGCLYERVALNHFEILMDDGVAKKIERHIFN